MDHNKFRKSLTKIGSALLEPSQKGPIEAKNELINLISQLRIHETIEENHLFPAVLRYAKHSAPKLLEPFKDEHHNLEKKLVILWKTLEEENSPISQILADFEFESSLKKHMVQEEKNPFPVIEKMLPSEIQEELTWLANELASMSTSEK